MYKKIIGYVAILFLLTAATLPAIAVSTMKTQDNPQQQNIPIKDKLDLLLNLLKRVKFGYTIFLKFITRGVILTRSTDAGTLVMKLAESQIKPIQSDLSITQAMVTISYVKVHYKGSSEGTANPSWITIDNTPKTFDLVHLEETPYDLAEIQVKAGSYDQIELFIASALVTINGKQYNLIISPQDVILNAPFSVKSNQKMTLTLVFDLAESIKESHDHKFFMKPAIKVV